MTTVFKDVRGLKDFADRTLSETWKWLLTVVDSTEAQLRYGQVLSLAGSPGPSVAPTQSRSGQYRLGFFNFLRLFDKMVGFAKKNFHTKSEN